MKTKRFPMVSAREIVGKKIVGFNPGLFPDGQGAGAMAHDPVIFLDDGSRLHFLAEETQVGEYGVQIIRFKMPKKAGEP